MVTVYTYRGCSTCRSAMRFLKERGVKTTEKPIRETPPSAEELRRMLAYYQGELKRLFNTSGVDYQELGLKDRLAKMSEEAAIDLLSRNGNLIKRPFLLTPSGGRVGFDPSEWQSVLELERAGPGPK